MTSGESDGYNRISRQGSYPPRVSIDEHILNKQILFSKLGGGEDRGEVVPIVVESKFDI